MSKQNYLSGQTANGLAKVTGTEQGGCSPLQPQVPTSVSKMSQPPLNLELKEPFSKCLMVIIWTEWFEKLVFKHGGNLLLSKLGNLIRDCWNQEEVPIDFKDANIIHLYTKN